jgi:two-component system nitrate/nitrite response regulator NarL
MPSPHKCKIFIVDDHFLIPQGITAMLANEPEFEIVGTSSDPTEVLDKLKNIRVNILLTDINMPEMSGVELTIQVRKRYPKIKVVVLSMLCETTTVKQLMAAGISGYVLKDTSPDELITALRTVADGDKYFTPQVQREMNKTASFVRFTTREVEIIELIAKQLNSREIAEQLSISERTVETHRANVFRKTSSASIAGLLQYAYQNNII